MIECQGKVVSNRKIGEGYYLLTTEITTKNKERLVPGQFAMIGTAPKGGVLLRRPYSVFDFQRVGKKTLVKFFYKVIGKGTRLLGDSTSGSYLSMLFPLGRGFEMGKIKGKTLCIVTGGIGVAPFYLLLKEALKYKPRKLYVFYGARTKDELFFLSFFRRYSDRIFISTDDGTKGYKGFITDLMRDKLKDKSVFGAAHDTLLIFSCGPRIMMKKVAQLAESKNIECHVSMEEIMGCGLGACLSCVVQSRKGDDDYLTVCKDGPVFNSEQIVI
jgi:dihydroorotate dehydrogenase electron transfer subunit